MQGVNGVYHFSFFLQHAAKVLYSALHFPILFVWRVSWQETATQLGTVSSPDLSPTYK